MSPSFFKKKWAPRELGGLVAKSTRGPSGGRVLPIWHNITERQLIRHSPTLADVKALSTSSASIDVIALKVAEIARPDLYEYFRRWALFDSKIATAKLERVPIASLNEGPIVHAELPKSMIVRIRLVHEALRDVLARDIDRSVDAFKRDVQPERDLRVWERLATTYLLVTGSGNWPDPRRKALYRALLAAVGGFSAEEVLKAGSPLSRNEIASAVAQLIAIERDPTR